MDGRGVPQARWIRENPEMDDEWWWFRGSSIYGNTQIPRIVAGYVNPGFIGLTHNLGVVPFKYQTTTVGEVPRWLLDHTLYWFGDPYSKRQNSVTPQRGWMLLINSHSESVKLLYVHFRCYTPTPSAISIFGIIWVRGQSLAKNLEIRWCATKNNLSVGPFWLSSHAGWWSTKSSDFLPDSSFWLLQPEIFNVHCTPWGIGMWLPDESPTVESRAWREPVADHPCGWGQKKVLWDRPRSHWFRLGIAGCAPLVR